MSRHSNSSSSGFFPTGCLLVPERREGGLVCAIAGAHSRYIYIYPISTTSAVPAPAPFTNAGHPNSSMVIHPFLVCPFTAMCIPRPWPPAWIVARKQTSHASKPKNPQRRRGTVKQGVLAREQPNVTDRHPHIEAQRPVHPFDANQIGSRVNLGGSPFPSSPASAPRPQP